MKTILLDEGVIYNDDDINKGDLLCFGKNKYGQFGLGVGSPDYIPKSSPVIVPWSKYTDRIIPAYNRLFFQISFDRKKGFKKGWYAVGSNHCGKLGLGENQPTIIPTPTRVPIDNIVNILVTEDHTFFLTKTKCFACGSNYGGCLGLQQTYAKVKEVYTPQKVSWYPRSLSYTEDTGPEMFILMNDNNVYFLGDDNTGIVNDNFEKYRTPHKIGKEYIKFALQSYFRDICEKCHIDAAAYNEDVCNDCNDLINNTKKLVDSEQSLQALLVQQYEPLQEYFQGLGFKDLCGLKDSFLIDSVRSEDVLLMRVFIRRYLWSVLSASSFESEHIVQLRPDMDGFINLKRSIITQPVWYYHKTSVLTIPDLQLKLQNKESIYAIDMGRNQISYKQFEDINNLLDVLPNLVMLALFDAHNYGGCDRKFSDDDKVQFERILSRDNLCYIVINYLYFPYDYFLELITNKTELGLKIMFINRRWKEFNRWKQEDNDMNERIVKKHQKFYKWSSQFYRPDFLRDESYIICDFV